jgi:hypothetical protein
MCPTVHRPARCKRRSPRCSIKCPQGNGGAVRHRRRRTPRRSGGWSTRCAYVGFLGLLGSEDARAASGRHARPSPAWARRRCGDCAGDPTRAGRGGAKGDGVRGGVHARQATHAGAQGWGSRWGVVATLTACFPLATVRAFYMATATRPSCARRRARQAQRVRRRHEKRAQGPALPSRLRRTCAGVHACERRGPQMRARGHARDAHATRAHRHGAATTNGGGVLRQEGRG